MHKFHIDRITIAQIYIHPFIHTIRFHLLTFCVSSTERRQNEFGIWHTEKKPIIQTNESYDQYSDEK